MLEFHVLPDRAQLEFSRLPFTSSTVFMLPELRFCPGCLTCAACTLTLAHQAMSFFPYWTLAESTRQIRSKKISPVEIAELHLKRIETLQPKLNAFVHVDAEGARQDRKSTRLNSSHTVISYAVFCLKKKKNRRPMTTPIPPALEGQPLPSRRHCSPVC